MTACPWRPRPWPGWGCGTRLWSTAAQRTGGLDEISTTGETEIATVVAGANCPDIRHFHPQDVGLPLAKSEDLRGGDAAENAAILQAIFSGQDTGPRRDIVLLNASAALVAAGLAGNLNEGLELGRKAILDGAVTMVLQKLRTYAA